MPTHLSTYDEVAGALADPRLTVPEAPGGAEVGTLAWLRASVSRFANGRTHHARRQACERELRGLDPDELRAVAHRLSGELSDPARCAPAAALAAAFGVTDPAVPDLVDDVSAAYFPGADAATVRRADRAVSRLLVLFTAEDAETSVARIALLVQGAAATTRLIDGTLRRLAPEATTAAAIVDTLQHDPPLTALRRVDEYGQDVTLDIRAAQDDAPDRPVLTFGAGLRPCPGRAQALALATGIVDGLRSAAR